MFDKLFPATCPALLCTALVACMGAEYDLDAEDVDRIEQEATLVTGLDNSFGSNGRVLSSGLDQDLVTSVAVDDEGNVYSAGSYRSGYNEYSTIMRHRPDGSLDTSFGYGGVVKKKLTPNNAERIADIALDASGRIVAVVDAAGGRFVVARFRSYGDFDTSFGVRGSVSDAFPDAAVNATSVAVDSSGRIIVGGYAVVSGKRMFAAARYTSWGALDSTFSSDGRVLIDFPTATGATATGIAMYGSYVVLAGTATVSGRDHIALARLNSSGGLDFSFGASGRAITVVPYATESRARAVAMKGSNIIVAGVATMFGHERFVTTRYHWSGRLNTGFDFDGIASSFTFSGWDDAGATSVLVDGEGRIVCGGFVEASSTRRFALMRYLDNGSLDPDFGASGRIVTDFTDSTYEWLSDLALDASERIVAVGQGYKYPYGRTAIARYSPRWSAGSIGGGGGVAGW